MAYDIIGDVHGHVDRVRIMLERLGYLDGGRLVDPGRSVVFVGDLIDRGPGQLETLRLVRSMVDAGLAQVVLGNHEFNAVAYATVDPSRLDYCRPHSDKNESQHRAFLDDVTFGSPLHLTIIEWFTTFPLWLDLDGLRVVHACWSDRHIEHLRNVLGDGDTLTEQVVIDGTTQGTPTYEAVETVLKGPEVYLDGACYHDKDGHRRDHARVRWWDHRATTLRTGAMIPDGTEVFDAGDSAIELPDRPLRDDEVTPYTGEVPVLFGHYWWRTDNGETFDPMATCLDYSVAKGGVLRAYRWDGEPRLDPTKFVDC